MAAESIQGHEHHQESGALRGELKRLLVAYDFSSASETALRYAVEIAKFFRSEITLAHIETPAIVNERMDDGAGEARHEQLAERGDLRVISDRLQSEGIEASYVIRCGSPTDVLVQLVSERRPDLLLMAAYGFHAADRISLGSTAEYLLRLLSCPALIVGPSVLSRPGCVRFSELLYASALPDAAGKAKALARELARKFAMHVHILHVEPSDLLLTDNVQRHNLEIKEEALADYFRRSGVGSSWTLRCGSPQDQILEQAKVVSADLLCLGVVHPATDPSQMGALSAIIRSAMCPVLTVPGAA